MNDNAVSQQKLFEIAEHFYRMGRINAKHFGAQTTSIEEINLDRESTIDKINKIIQKK